MIERLFGGYPELAYAKALHAKALPPNIEVNEFFFLAGRWLGSPTAQQNYISANYTHAFNYLLSRGVNVVAQLVAKRVVDGAPRYSLSCNTDITVDLLKVRRAGGAAFRMYGQVNSELPFMPGDGDLAARASSRASSKARTSNFRCSRRRRSRSPTGSMRSACMWRASCATAARCRSASARSAMRWRSR